MKASMTRRFYRTLAPLPYPLVSAILGHLFSFRPLHKSLYRKALAPLAHFLLHPPTGHQASQYLLANRGNDWRLSALAHLPPEQFSQWVNLKGQDHLDCRDGSGTILVNTHHGASRCVPLSLSRLGYTLTSLESHDALAKVGAPHRENLKVIEVGSGEGFLLKQVRKVQKHLASGGTLHIVPDGLQGHGGILLPFLGRERRFATSFAELALDTGSTVLPVRSDVNTRGRITITIGAPLSPPPKNLERAEQIRFLLFEYVDFLQSCWRDTPEGIRQHHLHLYQKLPQI